MKLLHPLKTYNSRKTSTDLTDDDHNSPDVAKNENTNSRTMPTIVYDDDSEETSPKRIGGSSILVTRQRRPRIDFEDYADYPDYENDDDLPRRRPIIVRRPLYEYEDYVDDYDLPRRRSMNRRRLPSIVNSQRRTSLRDRRKDNISDEYYDDTIKESPVNNRNSRRERKQETSFLEPAPLPRRISRLIRRRS